MNNLIKKKQKNNDLSRRDFLIIAGTVVIGVGFAGCFDSEDEQSSITIENDKSGIEPSKGYILVDTKKCQGCMTCMLACSLVHEGEENLSMSRIQVIQNPFEKYPVDITLEQCRQCVSPACVKACPTGALHAETKKGNVRMVDQKKCIGCMSCVKACPFEPSRAVWNFKKKRAQTCDLCYNTPFWKEKGGIDGKQACVSVCPLGAIKFTQEIPLQKGNTGYKINLRGKSWDQIGYPTS
ncbi:MAG: 4Fe-4S dicluster domain-containing protein [Spirochaetota bacterium]|nr:4Fe-4S dicluster domain-containing protein [Spirochaetota bacterium]